MYEKKTQSWLKYLDFISIDVVVLLLSLALAYLFRHGSLSALPTAYTVLAFMLVVFDVLVAAAFDTMNGVMRRGYYQEFLQSLKQTLLVMALVTIYMFSLQTSSVYSRITVYLTTGLHLVLGYLTRILWKQIQAKRTNSRAKTSTILVVPEKHVETLLDQLNSASELRHGGIILSNRDGTGEEIQGIKVVASLDTAAEYICRRWVDEVFFYTEQFDLLFMGKRNSDSDVLAAQDTDSRVLKGFDYDTHSKIEKLINDCRVMAIPVHINLPSSNIGSKTFVERIGNFYVLTMASGIATSFQKVLKRTMDICAGLVGSFFALLIMAVVGPMIKKASPGPVLFKQERIAQNGKHFKMYKLRSMYIDADSRKQSLMSMNRIKNGMMFKVEFDPRIIGNEILADGTRKTGIGEFIRRTSLDEFPQFFNVLKGEMSLVGTRPPTMDEWEKYELRHRARLACKPGITGMWQVNGRSEITDFEEVIRLDKEYIMNWNFGLDIKILLKTVGVVFTRKGSM